MGSIFYSKSKILWFFPTLLIHSISRDAVLPLEWLKRSRGGVSASDLHPGAIRMPTCLFCCFSWSVIWNCPFLSSTHIEAYFLICISVCLEFQSTLSSQSHGHIMPAVPSPAPHSWFILEMPQGKSAHRNSALEVIANPRLCPLRLCTILVRERDWSLCLSSTY